MNILTRKSVAASPSELLAQVRDAQAQHAAAVTDANQRLIEAHDAVFNEAVDRQRTLREQVKLLNAEIEGLDYVVDAANVLPTGVEKAPAA